MSDEAIETAYIVRSPPSEDNFYMFEDDIIRNIQEIIPRLDKIVIVELLKHNQYDFERTLDAALALSTSLEEESGTLVIQEASGDGNSAIRLAEPLRTQDNYLDSPNKQRSNSTQVNKQPLQGTALKGSNLNDVYDAEIQGEGRIIRSKSTSSNTLHSATPTTSLKSTGDITPRLEEHSRMDNSSYVSLASLTNDAVRASPSLPTIINSPSDNDLNQPELKLALSHEKIHHYEGDTSVNQSQQELQLQGQDSSNNTNNNNKNNRRGTEFILPRRFLYIPRYRKIITSRNESSEEYTVIYYRKSQKLGITVQEIASEIVIVSLQQRGPGVPLLAKESGVQIHDIIEGINHDHFSPWAEMQDALDLLFLSGPFVTMHFIRRFQPESLDLSRYPRHMSILVENDVISNDQVPVVHKMLQYFKKRVIQWDASFLAQRIDAWKLDDISTIGVRNQDGLQSYFDRDGSTSTSTKEMMTPAPSPAPSAPGSINRNSRRLSLNDIDDSRTPPSTSLKEPGNNNSEGRPASLSRRLTLTDSRPSSSRLSWGTVDSFLKQPYSQMEVTNLRPAISVRVLRAEQSKTADHVVYIIWVLDVKSGVEWLVKRRFREFYEFREVKNKFAPKEQALLPP